MTTPDDKSTDDSNKLTPKQIENWRNVLLGMIGSYALIMPDEEVQAMRDEMQGRLSESSEQV